jgi:ferredoxin
VLDIFPLQSRKERNPNLPESWRKAKYLLLIAILTAAVFTNLTLLVFDPITILFRSLTLSILPAIDRAFTAIEILLYPFPGFEKPLSALDTMLRPAVLPLSPALFRYAILYGSIFIAIIGLNLAAPRFWCRYLCPLGGLLGWISKTAIFRRVVTSDCKDCALCSQVCPVGTIRPERGYASDPSECTVCMECLYTCRLGGMAFTQAKPAPEWSKYDPGRRDAIRTVGLTMTAMLLAKTEPAGSRAHPLLVQPPGAAGNELLTKCIRCGECMRVCPTSGLQPALGEAGIMGISTPILISRLGYCDFSCNACGQACPMEAIPPLALAEKRQQIIGSAFIDQNRCIAWADHRDCIVCEEKAKETAYFARSY